MSRFPSPDFTELALSVQHGDFKTTQTLLLEGYNPNSKHIFYTKCRHSQKPGQKPGLIDFSNSTHAEMPLLRIATHLSDFNADIIECLLDHGADLDENSETNYCEGRTD